MIDPTDAARMLWAMKRVNIDGTTRDRFVWPVGVGGWVEQPGPKNGEACGVGLHLGKTWRGLSSGGSLTEAVALVVGYLPDDVLGEDDHKIRVSRCYVAPGMTSFPQVLRNGWAARANLTRAYLADAYLADAYLADAYLARANLADANLADANLADAYLAGAYLTRAYLTGAYLTRANLTGADLTRADLTGAYLTRANLTGADLTGAYLAGAYLTGATADRWTRWPAGFDPEGAGVNVR